MQRAGDIRDTLILDVRIGWACTLTSTSGIGLTTAKIAMRKAQALIGLTVLAVAVATLTSTGSGAAALRGSSQPRASTFSSTAPGSPLIYQTPAQRW